MSVCLCVCVCARARALVTQRIGPWAPAITLSLCRTSKMPISVGELAEVHLRGMEEMLAASRRQKTNEFERRRQQRQAPTMF